MILRTKIQIPKLRPNRIERTHLIEKIEQGMASGARLVLLSALAGAGKTTLAAEWAGRHPGEVAWVSIDASANDAVSLWQHILAAVEQIAPELTEEALAFLTGGGTSVQAAVTALINSLFESSRTLYLVLDDYHQITHPPTHTHLQYLVENQPTNLHLLLTTRADPPLPLSRMRARGQLVELRGADLRFQPEETTSFFQKVLVVPLEEAQLQMVQARTEGWAAGLHLAALSLQNSGPDAFFKQFQGSERYILSYLTDEVLLQQPPQIQSFLLQTALLDEFDASLCDAVLETDGSETVLQHLLHSNLFIQDLGGTYRYHHLFADLLRSRSSNQFSLAQQHALLRRAADWHAQRGEIAKAILYALRIPDHNLAGDLIEAHAYNLTYDGQLAAINEWLRTFPADVLARRPLLKLLMGMHVLIGGQAAQAEALLLKALEVSDEPVLRHEIKSQLLLAVLHQGKAEEALALSDSLLHDDMPAAVHARLRGRRALALIALGRLQDALQSIDGQYGDKNEPHYHVTAVQIRQHQAEILTHLGRLSEAASIHQAIIDEALRDPKINQPFFLAAQSYVDLAGILIEQNHLTEARDLLWQGRYLSGQAQWPDSLHRSYLVSAHLHFVDGEVSQAVELLKTQEPMVRQANHPRLHLWMLVRIVQYSLFKQDLVTSQAYADMVQRHRLANPPDRDLKVLVQAWMTLAQGHLREAYELADALYARPSEYLYPRLLAALTAVRAAAMLGEMRAAEDLLAEILPLAQAAGYQRLFLDSGPVMMEILKRSAGHNAAAHSYVDTLTQPVAARPTSDGLLTERELEILQLIAQGFSNKEIAGKLFVTIHTVKKHTTSVYEKLHVLSRTQAILRAQELSLI